MLTFSGPGSSIAERLRGLADSLEDDPGYRDVTMITRPHWEDVYATGLPFTPIDQRLVGITVLITTHPDDLAKDAIDAIKTE